MLTGYLTVLEAAHALGLSPQRVKQFIYAGRLPATRFGRQWLLSQSALDHLERKPAGRPKREKAES